MQLNSNIILPGFKDDILIKKTEERDGVYVIWVEIERKVQRCPECGEETNKVHDYRVQKIRHQPIFGRKTVLFYRKRRYCCQSCGKRFYEMNSIISRYQRESMDLRRAISIELIHGKSFKDTALRFGTSPTTVIRRFDKITSGMVREIKDLPKVIAIDEYKGDAGNEKYQLIIADPIKREPLDILPNRRKETLVEYLNKHGSKVEVVVMDMSHSFKAAVNKALGRPIIVADRFHFSRYIYWALERVRIRVQREFHEYDRKKCKRMRHIFYKANEKLSESQRWHLKRYLKMSKELKKAYELKEAYRTWFELAKANGTINLLDTKERLHEFYNLVKESGIKEYEKAIETFQNWQKEIMNSFAFDLHNGYIEGINNQTKVIKRNAFGFRRFDRFRAKILLHHQYKQIQLRFT